MNGRKRKSQRVSHEEEMNVDKENIRRKQLIYRGEKIQKSGKIKIKRQITTQTLREGMNRQKVKDR